MLREAARHPNWNDFLLLSVEDDLVIHEAQGSRGRYVIKGNELNIAWDRFSSETFTKIGGIWVHTDLLSSAVPVQNVGLVEVFGSHYLISRVQMIVPETRSEIVLRLNTSDLPTFEQVFINREYDSPDMPTNASRIVDLGANIGLATVYFASRYPSAALLAVEPESGNFEMLLCNTRHLGSRVHRYQAAVWTFDGTIGLRTKDATNRPLGSWGVQVSSELNSDEQRATCFTLATLLGFAGFSEVDILKVDIEGAELELFSDGIRDCLPRIRMIVVETHDRFRPGSEAAVRRALAPLFEEKSSSGENLIFTRKK